MHFIVRVLLRGFFCINFIMPLGGLLYTNFIVLILSYKFYPMYSTIQVSIIQILSYNSALYGFYSVDYIIWILLYGFHLKHSIVHYANFIVQISLSGFFALISLFRFYYMNLIVYILIIVFYYAIDRKKKEYRKIEK